MRVLVAVVVLVGCGDNLAQPPDAAPPIQRIPDLHAVVPCGSTWTLPIENPMCEVACVPRPDAETTRCDATHPDDAYITCGQTFVAHAVAGDFRGCCALFGTPTISTKLIFLTCSP